MSQGCIEMPRREAFRLRRVLSCRLPDWHATVASVIRQGTREEPYVVARNKTSRTAGVERAAFLLFCASRAYARPPHDAALEIDA